LGSWAWGALFRRQQFVDPLKGAAARPPDIDAGDAILVLDGPTEEDALVGFPGRIDDDSDPLAGPPGVKLGLPPSCRVLDHPIPDDGPAPGRDIHLTILRSLSASPPDR
jgi:hypothetical protein